MRRECKTIQEGLVDLAEGRSNDLAQSHVAGCEACQVELSRLQRIVASARQPMFKAPTDALERAKRLMPQRERRPAILVNRSFAASFARSGGTDAQLTLDIAGHSTRLMVTQEPNGWCIIGQLPSVDWALASDGPTDEDGRFSVTVPNLDSAILLHGPEFDVEIPPLSEFLDD